jgi:AcrR family transcriptional regulator
VPSSPSVWTRTPAKRRATLTREAIVAAAMAIADAEGIEAVSIRRVATELGARAMSLYTYIERKEDLFDLMHDEAAGEVLFTGELPADWRTAVAEIARRSRAACLRHPWMVDLSQRPRFGPNGMRHLEQSLAAIDGLDLEPRAGWRIIAAVDDYVRGYIIREAAERTSPRRDGFTDAERDQLLQPYFQRLADSGEFPRLESLLKGSLPGDDDNFEQGLTWLLDGIAGEIERTGG